MEINRQNNINKAPFFYISKLEAAKRQLEMAIKLFFNYGDIVAIHSLTWSAHNLLSDLGKNQSVESVLNHGLNYVVPEKRKEIRNTLRQAGNYFKHADKDSDKLLKFYYKATDVYMFDACQMYQNLTKEFSPLIIIYRTWYHLSNPGLLDSNIEEMFDKARRLCDPNNRTQLFNILLPLVMKADKLNKQ